MIALRQEELGAGGCYFAGSERSQFGIQQQLNQFNQLISEISSLSLVQLAHCARWSCTVLEARPLFELPVDDGGNWNQLKLPALFTRSHELHVFLFDCVIVPSTLRWAIADIIGRFSPYSLNFHPVTNQTQVYLHIGQRTSTAVSAVRRNDTFLSASNSYGSCGSSPLDCSAIAVEAEARSSR